MTGTVDLVVRARRAVVNGLETACAVCVAGERIVAIERFDADIDAVDSYLLADDEVLLPGLVDTHVHVNEPGRTEWEGFASATCAAAAGGITSIIDMPLNSVPPTTTIDALRVKQDVARDQIMVDVGFWGGAVPGNLGDLAALHEAGVFGFKCFLISSGVPEFGHLDAGEFAAAMAEVARLDALMLVHAEDARQVDESRAAGASYAGFLASRPPAAERSAIAQVIEQAQRSGARTHLLHLSSADALPELQRARAGRADLTVETRPDYLYFEAEEVRDGATEFKCCPPIREAANRDALWAGLGAGDIDLVVSDHSPSTSELKLAPGGAAGGDFGLAWGGIASIQVALPAVWTAARRYGHDLADLVRWMAQAPADRVGLMHKGRIKAGADADLVVLAPDEQFVVDVALLAHKNPVSAYAGRRLSGVVRRTWLRGVPIEIDSAPRGRFLRKRTAMSSYHAPRGGLPPQTRLTTDRARFNEAYVVLPRGSLTDIVVSFLPFWENTRLWVLARPLSGFAETFSQYIVEVSVGGGSDRPESDPDAEAVIFVMRGSLRLTIEGAAHLLEPGGYAFLPPGCTWTAHQGGEVPVTFQWLRKAYERIDGIDLPDAFVVNEHDVEPVEMPDTDGAWTTTRFVDQGDLRHDMHVNIVNFAPGGAIPFPETHVMEHGIYILEGKAMYLLNEDWVEVEAGDFLWLRAFCPQACYAGGPGRFRYLLYKDVNRHVRLRGALG